MRHKNFLRSAVVSAAIAIAIGSFVYASDIDDPVTSSVTIFTLTDYIEDFGNGTNAGGILRAFGHENVLGENVGAMLSNGVGQGREAATDSSDGSIRLQTDTDGFGATAAESFVGFSKDFSGIKLSSGADIVLDVSSTSPGNGFNAISYWVKNNGSFAGSDAEVVLEVVVGDGGDITPDDETDTFTGSTWTQSDPLVVAELVADSNNNNFQRVVVNLVGTVPGVAGGLARSVGPTDADADTEISDALLSNITAINVVMRIPDESSDTTAQRSVFVDDINFFENLQISLEYVDRFFAKSGESSAVFTLKVTVEQNNSGVEQPITITTTGAGTLDDGNGASGNPSIDTTTAADGTLMFTYSVPDAAEVAALTVDLR